MAISEIHEYVRYLGNRLLVRYLAMKAVLRWGGSADIVARSTYCADGFATTHHVGFLNDERFISAFNDAFHEVPEGLAVQALRDIAWRAHICTWAATQALALEEGDFVECGVWYGILSKTMCEYTDFAHHDRNFYLVDSWGSMPDSHSNASYQKDIFEIVERRFSKYPNVHLVRGVVPGVLPQVPAKKIAYLGIDMNSSEPERATLEFFYDKMVSGGIIYFDDYGWQYPALRTVVNSFFANKPESLLHFPSGNSIVIKI